MWEGARSCRVLANRRSKMDHAHGVGGRSYIHFCYVRTFVGSLHKQDLGMIAHQNTYVRTYVLSWNMQSRIKRSRLMALASWLLPCGARLLPLTNQPIPICTALGPNPRKLFCCELLGVVRTRPATVVLWSRWELLGSDPLKLFCHELSWIVRTRPATVFLSRVVRCCQELPGPGPRQSFCHESSRVLRTRAAPVILPGVVRDCQDPTRASLLHPCKNDTHTY